MISIHYIPNHTFVSQVGNRTSPAGPTWLLFANSSLEIENLFAHIYIPFNCEFLVAREERQGVFSIVEVYRVNRTQPLLILEVATWSLKDGAKWYYSSLYKRRQNLHGHPIKVMTLDVCMQHTTFRKHISSALVPTYKLISD